ncbi:MAG: MotA/TolQ/ExbB proton channel family protein [Deltaproteobacteria bacterium]|nr:MotA/TolQ/ExbB proton channel family protein [Deltaproteobacteria bacterium]
MNRDCCFRMATGVIFVVLTSVPLWAATWPEAASRAMDEARNIETDSRETLESVVNDKKALSARVSELKKAAAEQEAGLAELKAEFEALLAEEEDQRQALAEQEKDILLIETVTRTAARDAQRLLRVGLSAPGRPERSAAVREIVESEAMPGFPSIRGLAEALLAQAEDSGQISVEPGRFMGRDGMEHNGTIVRLGENAAYALEDGYVYALILKPEQGRFAAAAGDLPKQTVESVLAVAEGTALSAPLDFSGGVYVANLKPGGGLEAKIRAGGILVWPILGIGLLGLAIGLERLWSLLRIGTGNERLLSRVRGWAGRKSLAQSADHFEKLEARSPIARIVLSGLRHAESSREVLENVFHEAILKEIPRLERFLPTLSVLGAIAPLLGLLGTVTGMIHTFGVITMFGNSDAKLMSGGISEALITTQLGLAVAIPILFLHHVLERRVEAIVGNMEEAGVAMSVVLLGRPESDSERGR